MPIEFEDRTPEENAEARNTCEHIVTHIIDIMRSHDIDLFSEIAATIFTFCLMSTCRGAKDDVRQVFEKIVTSVEIKMGEVKVQ